MRRTRSACTFLVAAAVLAGGCSVNTSFVYKPAAPAAGAPKVPAKVAVVAFRNGTEDFERRGSWSGPGHRNLTRTAVPLSLSPIPPEQWAKSFADDLAASGNFGAARFVYSPAEIVDEEFVIEGAVTKASIGNTWPDGNEFAFSVSAARRADNTVVWSKDVAKSWKTRREDYSSCGASLECAVDRYHVEINTVFQGMFAEARADLLRRIASLSGGGGDDGPARAASPAAAQTSGATPPAPSGGESMEQTIERILEGR